MDPQHVHELVTIRVGGQKRSEDRSAARYEGTSCPPNVQPVWCWKRRHRRAFTHALNSQRSDWEPALDEALVSPFAVSYRSGSVSNILSAARTRRGFFR